LYFGILRVILFFPSIRSFFFLFFFFFFFFFLGIKSFLFLFKYFQDGNPYSYKF